jgi:hypothetical protein
LYFPCFLMLFSFGANNENLLHIIHCTISFYYPLAEIHLYQSYFNMSCHWHIWTCVASCGYVDIVQKIVNKGANVNAKGENGKFSFAFNMWKHSWWIVSILCNDTQSSLYFIFCYMNHKLYKFVWCLAIMWKLCENYIHKRQEGENVKAHYEFGNDSMNVCFKHKTRM